MLPPRLGVIGDGKGIVSRTPPRTDDSGEGSWLVDAPRKDAELSGLRVVFFGMTGAFSRPPLDALLSAGVQVRAIILPVSPGLDLGADTAIRPVRLAARSTRKALPMAGGPGYETTATILDIAARAGIPAFEVTRLADPATLDALAAFDADAFCVACFTKRLPAEVLRLPRLGCLNVHPSLLPRHRGPDPMFWTFRAGDREAGVTSHLMDSGLDAGPVLLQERLPLPDGIAEVAVERWCAERGGALLVASLRGLAAGTLVPRPQDAALTTVEPWPSAADYLIPHTWSARRAYNFAAAIHGRGKPTRVMLDERLYAVVEPLGYSSDEPSDALWRMDGDVLALRCTPGVFHARVVALP